MVNRKGLYWWSRMRFLEAVKKDGGRLPLSVLCKDIFSVGASLTKITDEMEEKGFIVKEKYTRIVKTSITDKGENLLRILKELNGVWECEV